MPIAVFTVKGSAVISVKPGVPENVLPGTLAYCKSVVLPLKSPVKSMATLPFPGSLQVGCVGVTIADNTTRVVNCSMITAPPPALVVAPFT